MRLITLPQFISLCGGGYGGLTNAAKLIGVTPQCLHKAIKSQRSIFVKLDSDEQYHASYEVKQFPKPTKI